MRRPAVGAACWVLVGVAALLAACAPVIAPVAAPAEDAPPALGPGLVVDVLNGSPGEATVAYEFESANAGGGGEGAVPACERNVMHLGDIAGSYEVTVAGTTVVEGQVPPGMPARGYLLARVRVAPDGEVTLDAPPHWIATAPVFMTARVADCG